MSYRMPTSESVNNLDGRSLSFRTNMATAIRIDDNSIDNRRAWSSAKVYSYAQPSETELVYQFVSNYGALYYSEYDEAMYDEWTDVIKDAKKSLEQGKPFYVAWSPNRSAQVVDVDLEAEPRMTVIIDSRSFAMSDTGIHEVPIYNIVFQYPNYEEFPEEGTVDRLYIDVGENRLYYWANGRYVAVTGSGGAMHKLTFGAGETYVYDGSEDVTVPVYLGAID